MNGMEQKHPGAKRNIVDHFLGILPGLKKEYGKEDSVHECTLCGEPSRDKVCSACLTVKRVEANKIFKKAKISL